MKKDAGPAREGRAARAKKFLAPSAKYEIYLQLVRGETTVAGAAEQAGVDRSTIMKLRQVAKEGVMAALSASKPGPARPSGMWSWRPRTPRSPGSVRQ